MTSQSTANTPTPDQIRRAPKVLLHDHLDGGLRPGTVVDLARDSGYPHLPDTDPGKLGLWFREAADSGSLERYLETFSHTVGVMQTRDALVRVARECAEDLAADGVVYAEVRYAPEQHLEAGLTLEEVVEAVTEGFREGERLARENGHRIRVGALLTAMRHAARALEIAELANRHRDSGVVGFDIAGAEAGFPPTRHLDAFEYLKRENNHENIRWRFFPPHFSVSPQLIAAFAVHLTLSTIARSPELKPVPTGCGAGFVLAIDRVSPQTQQALRGRCPASTGRL